MRRDRRHWLLVPVMGLALALGLTACGAAQNSQGAEKVDESQEEVNEAESTEPLTAQTMEGDANLLSGATITTPNSTMTYEFKYDDAGNKTSQTVKTNFDDMDSEQTYSWVYNGDNEMEKYSFDVADETVAVTYEAPSISTDDNGNTIVYYKGQGDSGLYEGSEFQTQFTVSSDHALVESNDQTTLNGEELRTNTENLNVDPSTWINPDSDLSSPEALVYNSAITEYANGDPTSLKYSVGDVSPETTTFTWADDTLTVADPDMTFKVTRDSNGLVTKLEDEATKLTIEFEYTTVAKATDFNRAIATDNVGAVIVSGVFQNQILGSANTVSESMVEMETVTTNQ